MFKYVDCVATVLLVIGGLNWGTVAFFEVNMVDFVFGGTMFTKVVYGLVTASAVYEIFKWTKIQGCWR